MPHDPDLAIVIPVFRERQWIARLLEHLSRCRGITRCGIIVVDGDRGSTATPEDILPIKVLLSPAGRGTQMNAGADEALAPAIAFLHVDTFPPVGFVELILGSLKTHSAAAFDLSIETSRPFVKLVAIVGRLRSRITRVPYGDQVHAFRTDVFRSLGGFRDLPIMEDVDIMDRLKARGLRVRILRRRAVTSGRRWEIEGPIRTTLRNWRLMLAYRAGVPPQNLAKWYRPHPMLKSLIVPPVRIRR